MIFFSLFFVLLHHVSPSPIVKILEQSDHGADYLDFTIPQDHCVLTPKLGDSGTRQFLEECEGIERFPTVPKPLNDEFNGFGVHPVVCCPQYLPDSSICFPSDPWCYTYEEPEYEDYPGETEVYDYDYLHQDLPTMAEEDCAPYNEAFSVESQCVALSQCPGALDSPSAPELNYPCGFDTELSLLKVCCPPENITQPQILAQPPRFPRSGRARRVEDKTKLCSKWRRNDACRLDKHFLISDEDDNPDNGNVYSRDMFDFMQKSCSQSCGWVESGCHDEHPRCEEWSRLGMCVTSGMFMAHTCRESCGVCGFLAPENKEIQTRAGRSYTDFTQTNFECGRYKSIKEVNEGNEDRMVSVETVESDNSDELPANFAASIDLRTEEEDLEVFSFNLENKDDFFCGSTIVNDRWMIAAAHCYDDFKSNQDNQPREIKVNTLRDETPFKEVIEIKRVYQHPNYQYPKLYDDIAVVELGRRIAYDYEKYGDTPTCLDQNPRNDVYTGDIATVQGYGKTENGTAGALLETNVTVISNEDCIAMLRYNTTLKKTVRNQGTKHLPYGLNYGMFCAQGLSNEKGIFSGSCKGDSGGPLQTVDTNNDDRTTLIGIVSGGIGCGRGIPGWYTKVSFHINWIRCIIDKSVQFNNNQKKVVEACKDEIQSEPTCVKETDLVFGVEGFREIKNKKFELCESSA